MRPLVCAVVLLSTHLRAGNPANDPTVDAGSPEVVDWSQGSAWTKKVQSWTAKAHHPVKWAAPAFGRDVLNVEGARIRHRNNGKSSQGTVVSAHAMRLTASSGPQMYASISGTLGLGEQDTQYLEELAYGLGYDPLRIYNWVLTHVEYVPYNGLVKGAHVTALELRGNDYDQCVLLASLLKQCSSVAAGAVGYISANVTYSNAEISAWTGWDCNTAEGDPFAIVGIPDTVGSGVVTVHRVLLTLTLNGTTYILDPAFKHSTRATPLGVTDLVPSYSASSISAAAAGSEPSADEYSGADVGSFGASLSSVAANYAKTAAQSYRDRDARSVLGLPVITEAQLASLPTNIAQTYTTIAPWQAIPASDSLDLTIQMGSSTNTITYHWCDLANDVFNISFDGSGRASLYRESQLELTEDGTPSGDFSLSGTRTYPQGSGSPAPFASTAMSRSGRSVMFPSFDSSRGRLEEMSRIQADDVVANGSSDTALIHTLALAAMHRAVHQENYVSVAAAMTDRVSFDYGSVWFYHARGTSYSEWWGDGPKVLSVYLDLKYPTVLYAKFWEMIWPFASATESLSLEELSNTNAGSTASVIDSALRDGYSVFRLTQGNYNSMIGRINGGVLSGVQNHVNAGNEAFVPSNYNVPIYNNTGVQCAIAYLPYAPDPNSNWPTSWHSGAWVISGGFNGGFGTQQQTNSTKAAADRANRQNVQTATGDAKGADPVDLVTGAYTYEGPAMKVGNTSEPSSLDFHTFYTASLRDQDSAKLGRGWTHSYDMFVSEENGSEIDLRSATVAQIAPMLVAAKYLSDIITNAPSAKEFALRCLAANWAAEQFRHSEVAASLGNSRIRFDRLADGTYLQASSVPATLTKAGDGSYTLAFRHGNSIAFRASDGHATSIADQYGNTMTLDYSSGPLTTVTDAYGRTLTFNYTGGELTSVVDSTSRQMVFAYGTDFTIQDPDGGVTTYSLTSDRNLTSVTDARSRRVIENEYDYLHRVWAQRPLGDASKTTYLGFAPGSAYEQDAFGIQAWTSFDSRGRRVAYTDQVGNTTKWTYDGADRLTSVTTPRGNTRSYGYDSNDVMTSETDPLSHTRTIVPDAQSRPWQVANFEGQITTYLYNTQHDVTSIAAAGNITTTFSYDTHGREYTEHPAAYAAGVVKTYAYDGTGGLQTITFPDSTTESYTCDALGNVKTLIDRNGHKTTYTYNNRRLLTGVTRWDGTSQYTKQIGYDAAGDIQYEIDADGRRADYEHDALGNSLTVKKDLPGRRSPSKQNRTRIRACCCPRLQMG